MFESFTLNASKISGFFPLNTLKFCGFTTYIKI